VEKEVAVTRVREVVIDQEGIGPGTGAAVAGLEEIDMEVVSLGQVPRFYPILFI
jgi:hypothetical protein